MLPGMMPKRLAFVSLRLGARLGVRELRHAEPGAVLGLAERTRKRIRMDAERAREGSFGLAQLSRVVRKQEEHPRGSIIHGDAARLDLVHEARVEVHHVARLELLVRIRELARGSVLEPDHVKDFRPVAIVDPRGLVVDLPPARVRLRQVHAGRDGLLGVRAPEKLKVHVHELARLGVQERFVGQRDPKEEAAEPRRLGHHAHRTVEQGPKLPRGSSEPGIVPHDERAVREIGIRHGPDVIQAGEHDALNPEFGIKQGADAEKRPRLAAPRRADGGNDAVQPHLRDAVLEVLHEPRFTLAAFRLGRNRSGVYPRIHVSPRRPRRFIMSIKAASHNRWCTSTASLRSIRVRFPSDFPSSRICWRMSLALSMSVPYSASWNGVRRSAKSWRWRWRSREPSRAVTRMASFMNMRFGKSRGLPARPISHCSSISSGSIIGSP